MKTKTYEEIVNSDKRVWEQTRIGEWLDASFHDNESGEFFFVELKKEEGETMTDFIAKCAAKANEYFDDANFVSLVYGDTAELLGYDTY